MAALEKNNAKTNGKSGTSKAGAQPKLAKRKSHHLIKGIVAAFLMAALGVGFALSDKAWGEDTPDSDKIVIVSTNDLHASISSTFDQTGNPTTLGYDTIAGYRNSLRSEYSNVLLVDAGDYLQGGIAGTLFNGLAPASVMEKVGYDVITPGNHEFDYAAQTLKDIMTKPLVSPKYAYITTSGTLPIVCSNLYNTESKARVFDPYKIITVNEGQKNEAQIAFVGVTTPVTLTTSLPSHFQDETGKTIYGFCGDDTGEALYRNVQDSIDAARAEMTSPNAYVILLAHLGQKGSEQRWRSDTLANNISGANLIIDAHSHEKYLENNSVTDKTGAIVPIIQAGYQGEALGETVIDLSDGSIASQLIEAGSETMRTVAPDANVKEFVDKIEQTIEDECSEKIAETSFDLLATSTGTGALEGKRLARAHETNLGDLVCDAIRSLCKTDIALNNGGSMRSDIKAGGITLKTIMNVLPFSNCLCISELSGQDILDALEMGVRKYPEENGGFLQVSGLTYQFRDDIASSVEVDETGNFVRVAGEYRVHHVMVGGKPLELDKTYSVGGLNFLLNEGGDGYSMMENGTIRATEIAIDRDMLYHYLRNTLGGTVPAQYADALGEGRITVNNDWQEKKEDPKDNPGKKSGQKPEKGSEENPGTGFREIPATGDDAPWAGFAAVAGLAGLAGAEAIARKRAA